MPTASTTAQQKDRSRRRVVKELLSDQMLSLGVRGSHSAISVLPFVLKYPRFSGTHRVQFCKSSPFHISLLSITLQHDRVLVGLDHTH